MSMSDDRGDAMMHDAYAASRAAKLARVRAALGPELPPTSVQPAVIEPSGEPPRASQWRNINWTVVGGTLVAIPIIGGLTVLIFGLLVWAATWVWSHV